MLKSAVFLVLFNLIIHNINNVNDLAYFYLKHHNFTVQYMYVI